MTRSISTPPGCDASPLQGYLNIKCSVTHLYIYRSGEGYHTVRVDKPLLKCTYMCVLLMLSNRNLMSLLFCVKVFCFKRTFLKICSHEIHSDKHLINEFILLLQSPLLKQNFRCGFLSWKYSTTKSTTYWKHINQERLEKTSNLVKIKTGTSSLKVGLVISC